VTTIGAINKVGRDAGQFRLLEPAQGQRTQLLVSRMGRQGHGHGRPLKTTKTGAFPAEKETNENAQPNTMPMYQPSEGDADGERALWLRPVKTGWLFQSMRPSASWRMRCRTRDFAM
jgi:hypothetical protein